MTEQPHQPDAYEAAVMQRMGQFRRQGSQNNTSTPEADEMRRNRQVMRRVAASGPAGGIGGASISFATGRPRDPMFYWKQNNLPYDLYDNSELKRVRAYMRLIYQSHHLIGSMVDIYTKYPLLGMQITSKDEQIEDFYNDLFFDEDGLNYEEFLIDFGREYWTVGEAIPFGSFNESLGVWEDEELLNPDDVEVQHSPFLKDPRYFIRLPQTLREIITRRTPTWEYEQLMNAYPELQHYTAEDALMPVSSVLLRHYRFKADTFNRRGVPILLRALRPIMQEEMFNSAMDAVADRLYTPLVLARLGASATDLGTSVPWIPNEGDLQDFEESLDAALSADFRVLVHHFGIQMESVFGRENMPDMTPDFERVEDQILQTLGLSKTMLTGASSGQTYAADALNRDLISQLLTTYQKIIKRHFRQRAMVVAEAQEHYDYDERNGKRYVKMEEVLEIDEETGEERIVEQPKLLIPELKMRCTTPETQVLTRRGYRRADSLIVGDKVIAWDTAAGMAVESEISMSESNGIKATVRVSTREGRRIDVTENHPFWTDRGWVNAEDVKVGDRLRVGSHVDLQAAPEISERLAYFLGMMVGDGGLTDNDVRLSTADPEMVEAASRVIRPLGCQPIRVAEGSVDWRLCQVAGRRVHPNPVKALLNDHGLWGQSGHEKRVPEAVWASGPHTWAAFLSGYLDADGTVVSDTLVAWDSCNLGLMKDVQALLAMLGVRSMLNETYRVKEERTIFRVAVQSKRGLRDLARLLHPEVARKQEIWTRIDLIDERRLVTPERAVEIKAMSRNGMTYNEIANATGISRSVVCRAVQGHYDDEYVEQVSVEWDEVDQVEALGEQETWALTVSTHHTHITEGLVTHNTMNVKDEESERQFLEALRASGMPISMRTRLVNIPIDLDDEVEMSRKEAVDMAIAEQETRKEIYSALRDAGLPIPQDLRDDFMPRPLDAAQPLTQPMRVPMLGLDNITDSPNLAPTQQDYALPTSGVPAPGQPAQAVDPFQSGGQEQGNPEIIPDRPSESDEMRADMPKASMYRSAARMREVSNEHYVPPPEISEMEQRTVQVTAVKDGKEVVEEVAREYPKDGGIPRGRWSDPKHVGMRRHAGVTANTLWGSLEEDEGDEG